MLAVLAKEWMVLHLRQSTNQSSAKLVESENADRTQLFKDLARKTGGVLLRWPVSFHRGLQPKQSQVIGLKNHPASGYRNKYFVPKNFFHLAFIGLGGGVPVRP